MLGYDSGVYRPKPVVRDAIAHPIDIIEVFDVGAMIEGRERYAGLCEQKLVNVTGFEPNASELQRLREHFPMRQYHDCFLGRGGPATFYVTRYPGCSSLYEPNPDVIDLFQTIGTALPYGNFGIVRSEEVQTVRLDELPDMPPCDYLKVDVQGSEVDVLEGASKAIASALVVEAEVLFLPLYKNQPTFSAVAAFLEERGFVLHKLIDVCGRAFKPMALAGNPFAAMSQMLWADAVFIRNFSKLGEYSDMQLLKGAAILYEAYDSHDLVHLLLAEYDRRRETTLAENFAQAVSQAPDLPLAYLNLKSDHI